MKADYTTATLSFCDASWTRTPRTHRTNIPSSRDRKREWIPSWVDLLSEKFCDIITILFN
jgi:hypothetical protein